MEIKKKKGKEQIKDAPFCFIFFIIVFFKFHRRRVKHGCRGRNYERRGRYSLL